MIKSDLDVLDDANGIIPPEIFGQATASKAGRKPRPALHSYATISPGAICGAHTADVPAKAIGRQCVYLGHALRINQQSHTGWMTISRVRGRQRQTAGFPQQRQ